MAELETRLAVMEQIVMSLGATLALTMQKVDMLERAFVSSCQENAELELALYAKNNGHQN